MRRGSGSEVQGGLYTLNLNSQPQNQSDSTYTVAFEDRGDASNFCFLLESLFEDLDEFSADIAPLPKKVRILNCFQKTFQYSLNIYTTGH